MATKSVASLTSGSDTTNAASYSTASISPSADKLILCWAENRHSGTAGVTASGCGLTWQLLASIETSSIHLYLFGAMGASPSSGAVTFTITNPNSAGMLWSIYEVTGVDDTDVATAVVQAVAAEGSGTSGSVTLAAFEDALNMVVSGFAHAASEATTPDGDFTEIHDVTMSSPNGALETQYRLANDTGPTASWSTDIAWRGIAAELRDADVGSGGSFIPTIMVM